ncbi:pilus assembly protein TadG-related protein [Glycomyces sp. NPDC047369]
MNPVEPLPLLVADGDGSRHRASAGWATGVVVVMLFALVAVLGLVADAGLTVAAKARAQTAAAEAARAGAAELDVEFLRTNGIIRLDPAAAQAAASAWLGATGHSGTASATVAEVTVTIQDAHPTQVLTFVGVSSIPFTATATAAPNQGDDAAAGPITGSPP